MPKNNKDNEYPCNKCPDRNSGGYPCYDNRYCNVYNEWLKKQKALQAIGELERDD